MLFVASVDAHLLRNLSISVSAAVAITDSSEVMQSMIFSIFNRQKIYIDVILNKFFSRMLYETDNRLWFYAAIFEQFFLSIVYTLWFFGFMLLYMGLCSYVNPFVTDFYVSILELNTETRSPKIISILKSSIQLHNDLLKYC